MNEQTQQQKWALTDIFPQLIVIAIILLMTANYYVVGGIEPISLWRTWNGYLAPFGLIVVVLAMVRNHIMDLVNRRSGWQYSILTLAAFAVFLFLAETDPEGIYLLAHNAIYNTGNVAVSSIVALSFLSAFFRVYLARSPLTAMLIALTFLSFMLWTPLGDMIWPPLTLAGEWIHVNISSAGDGGWWIAAYIGMGALLIRILTFKEKLKPT
jgi:hypothetical protein